MTEPRPLAGKVALVAGATRGAGRGIACMLGEAGAIVYCTGRGVRGKPAGSRPETIEDTAEMVTALGGHGIAVQVDHIDEEQVIALMDRIREEQGRIDILVNDIWGGDELTEWGTPFWKLEVSKGFEMLEWAIHTHILTSRHGVPLMLDHPGGLLVEITDGDAVFGILDAGERVWIHRCRRPSARHGPGAGGGHALALRRRGGGGPRAAPSRRPRPGRPPRDRRRSARVARPSRGRGPRLASLVCRARGPVVRSRDELASTFIAWWSQAGASG